MKILFGQTLVAEDVQKLNEKFGVEEKVDVKCSCGADFKKFVIL